MAAPIAPPTPEISELGTPTSASSPPTTAFSLIRKSGEKKEKKSENGESDKYGKSHRRR